MQWFLKKCYYDIQNPDGNNNKYPLKIDLFFLIAYTILSLFNAIQIWLPVPFLTRLGIIYSGAHPTLMVIVINFIVLIRLNINLYIKSQNNMNAELKKLYEQRQTASELTIKTWMIRMWILSIGYVIDIVIGIFCIIYGTQLYKSLSGIVIISILETFLNSLIDNYEIRYAAIPKVYKRI